MLEKEIIQLWKQGLSKEKLAQVYRRKYNDEIKSVRIHFNNKYNGKLLTNYQALEKIEKVIYKYLKEEKKIIK